MVSPFSRKMRVMSERRPARSPVRTSSSRPSAVRRSMAASRQWTSRCRSASERTGWPSTCRM
uniref:Uncharacterized protein n=1 Tax=Arundo donax TaxID=35708 RepID=A0A0A9F5E9_ARUDO